MKIYLSVALPHQIVSIPPPSRWAIQDWGVVFSISLGIGSILYSAFMARSKSQAQELDRLTMEEAEELSREQSGRLEKMMERLDQSVTHLDGSIKNLGEKITGLTERIAVVETKQQVTDLVMPGYDRQFTQLRSRQDDLDRRLIEIQHGQKVIFSHLKTLTKTISSVTK
jgi:chromosome segregation ATPase